jgi:hypothetical protein
MNEMAPKFIWNNNIINSQGLAKRKLKSILKHIIKSLHQVSSTPKEERNRSEGEIVNPQIA